MIAFIGAMDEEISELLALMDTYKEKKISNLIFYEGLLANKKCILTKSGIGKINAAITTTVLFENFDIDGVVNIGTAGGLLADLKVLDVIVSNRICNYDLDVINWEKSFESETSAYKADKNYIKIMEKIIDDNNERVFIGDIASGDSFICNKHQVDKILNDYPSALCAEMEAAGVAQVCKHYKKPFIVIRSLSDITVNDNNELDFETYLTMASKKSAKWCREFIINN